jgi:hypothetical protein
MTLKVKGTNFPTQAAILWNGAALATTVVDANTLSSTVGSSSLANPATVQLKVQNTQTMQESPAAQVTITDPNAPPPSALTLSIATLPQGIVGASYTGTFTVTGGTSPYTWSVASGQLPPGLSVAATTGIISGTPTSAGNYSFSIKVTDSGSSVQSATTTVSLPVVAAPVTSTPLTINSSPLSSGTVGSTYSTLLQPSGGTAPYTWSFTGSLPTGLSLAATTGIISGTPSASGTFNFTATVADSGNPAQTKSTAFSLVIAPLPLTITSSSLPSGTISSTYSTLLQAGGGTAPYTWSIAAGSPPTGLTLTATTGIISGTPTASGTFTFTAAVSDAGTPAQAKSVSLSIVIAPSALTINTSALPSGTQSSSYSSALQASGGTTPYTWSITSGALPAGLSLAPTTGIISGTPTASGNFTIGATVKDAGSPSQATTATVTLSVVAAGTPLAISSTTLPKGTPNQTYSATLNATGGTAPYTWSITVGSLPAGLALAPSTGRISGTPTATGTINFTATVTDSGSPAQTKSVALSLVVAAAAPPTLTLNATLPSGTVGTAYSSPMTATGGTPAYTWSITSGSLPPGVTLAATTGIISGTPTTSGTYNFTATVSDNGTPAQTTFGATSIVVAAATAPPGPGTTWYVRPDGGTRYSSNVTTGQCDGQADVAYSGSGTNQHCAFNDFRYLWDDNSGAVGQGAWVIAGGDTVIIRGCTALSAQQNPANPACRLGWDNGTSGNPPNAWCYGIGNNNCFNPPIPAGTSSQHTRILGQNYAACNTSGATNPKLYESNLAQLFGGFGQTWTFNLENTQYVDIQCIELTTHNGQCTTYGSPRYPRGCSTSQPLDDYAANGVLTNNATSNVTFQDVYIHGFNSSGMFGPIGGPIIMTRMFVGFNTFAGWNFDDGSSTPDAPGSTITATHVIMEGNGCQEQYPLTNDFPALVCYDTNSGGFGDSWSGQNTTLDSFICDDCQDLYNTKDAFIGPHTWISTLTITNSTSIGNMGQDWKWGGSTSPNNTTFLNNLTIGNCLRMSQPLPGAPSNYNQYLTGFCRAAGNVVASVIPAGSTWLIANNTWVTYQPTIFDIACPIGSAPCSSTVNFTNNVVLGYQNPNSPYGLSTPALYYIEDPSINVVSSHNVEFGTRNDDCNPFRGTGNICSDPLLAGEPAPGTIPPESTLDNFNFHLTSHSPAIGAGVTYPALLSTDYFGTATSNPPVIGAVEP